MKTTSNQMVIIRYRSRRPALLLISRCQFDDNQSVAGNMDNTRLGKKRRQSKYETDTAILVAG